MAYVLRPQAEQDILEAARFIADRNPQAARNWRREILASCRMLDDMPRSGSSREQLPEGVRFFPNGEYVVFYRERKNGIDILRVIHAARDWTRLMR